MALEPSGRSGVHRAVQRRMARRAPRALLTACGPREDAGGRVSRAGNCPENPDRYTIFVAEKFPATA